MKRFFAVFGFGGLGAVLLCELLVYLTNRVVCGIVAFSACALILSAFFILRRVKLKWFYSLVVLAVSGLIFSGLWLINYNTYENEAAKYCGTEQTLNITVLSDSKKTSTGKFSTEFRIRDNGRRSNIIVYSAFSMDYEIGDTIQAELLFFEDDGGFGEYQRSHQVVATAYLSDYSYHSRIDSGALPLHYFFVKVRYYASTVADRYLGNQSDFAKALLFGDKEGLAKSETEDLRDAGLSHTVAVSGLHISIFLAVLAFMLSPIKIRWIKTVIYAAALFCMCAICSFTPSVIRAAVVATAAFGAYLVEARADRLNSLGIVVTGFLVYSPFIALNVSFILSVMATLGLILVAGPTERFIKTSLFAARGVTVSSIGGTLIRIFSASFACFLFTYAVVLFVFGEVAYVGLFSNMICVPLVEIVFILCLITVGLGCIPLFGDIAAVVGIVAKKGVSVFMSITEFFAELSSVKLNPLVIPIGVVAGIICYVLVRAFVKQKGNVKRFSRILIPIAVSVSILVGGFIFAILPTDNTVPPPKNSVVFAFVSVGQGTGNAIISGDDAVIIDCGGNDNPGENMVTYLCRNNVENIDTVILSHLHDDHTSGLDEICEVFDVKRIIIPYTEGTPSVYADVCNIAADEGATLSVISNDTSVSLNDVDIDILTKHLDPDDSDENNNSLVCIAEYENFDVIYTGDITKESEERLVETYGSQLRATVLAVPHHGSKHSSSEGFVSCVKPEYSVISVGNNGYGHPTEEAISRLLVAGKVLRTDTSGTIEFVVDEDGYTINKLGKD